MKPEQANDLATKWFSGLSFGDPRLLQTEDDDKTVCIKHHENYGRMVFRSKELTERIKIIRKEISQEYERNLREGLSKCPIGGVIYFVYQREEKDLEDITPIYVGIARTLGKKGGLSTLFDSGWMRFADTVQSNGHIGKINECLHGIEHAYQNWVDVLFHPHSSIHQTVTLRQPAFVKIEKWGDQSQSIVPQLGASPLAVEEMLRIWILNLSGRGSKLVNRDGNDL